MRLLIIEDDKELALVMRKGLEERGFTVDISHTGIEGEEKAHEVWRINDGRLLFVKHS